MGFVFWKAWWARAGGRNLQVINRGRGVCSLSFWSYVKSPTVSGSEHSECTSSSHVPGSPFYCHIPRRKYSWGNQKKRKTKEKV